MESRIPIQRRTEISMRKPGKNFIGKFFIGKREVRKCLIGSSLWMMKKC